MLCQNSDLAAVLTSMQQIEDRVNTRLHYPWTLLNNESFTEEFMSCVIHDDPYTSPYVDLATPSIQVMYAS